MNKKKMFKLIAFLFSGSGLILILVMTISIAAMMNKILASNSFSISQNQTTGISSFSENERTIYYFLKNKEDLKDVHVAAIMANMWAEGMLDPTSIETIYDELGYIGPKKKKAIESDFDIKSINLEYSKKYPKIQYAGIGICGWTNGQNRILLDFAKSRGRNWYELSLQLDLFWMEFCPNEDLESSVYHVIRNEDYKTFLQMTDVKMATKFVMTKFEGIDTDDIARRQNKAEEYLNKISSGAYEHQAGDYVEKALLIAEDNAHGYCQAHRHGGTDYDCSSFVYHCLVDTATIEPYESDVSTVNLGYVLQANGFVEYSFSKLGAYNLERGDILVNPGRHAEIYIGENKCVAARIDSSGTNVCKAGEGDQNGNEISIGNLSSNWMYVYRRR